MATLGALRVDSETAKKLKSRANRARRELLKEKETYGSIHDRAGKRYLVPVFYVLSGDIEKALEFYAWFKKEFPDDIGEPVFDLYWALALYRRGDIDKARIRLQSAMLQNIYLLPFLFNEPIDKLNIWHASNLEYPEYLQAVEEYLAEPTSEERAWIKKEFYSERFRRLYEHYVDTYQKLLDEKDIEKRRRILDDWYRFSEGFF